MLGSGTGAKVLYNLFLEFFSIIGSSMVHGFATRDRDSVWHIMVCPSKHFPRDCKEEADVWDLVRPEKRSLTRLKRLSMRRRAWFTVLSWTQRRLLDAVIGTVDQIRSHLLLRVLEPLVKRLLIAVGGDVRAGALALIGEGACWMMMDLAERIVGIAEAWGNRNARQWLDQAFIRYLVIMNLPQNRNAGGLAFQ